ncbi:MULTISPECIES: hypothetical protein [unclassified Paenibacillus]|nr:MULTISPECIES: hypothetical protein [unclassified Paenibacillus]CAH0119608.1 hypothetical protein PAE9249_02113 [Paenibacillus sp. CECT 9249]
MEKVIDYVSMQRTGMVGARTNRSMKRHSIATATMMEKEDQA